MVQVNRGDIVLYKDTMPLAPGGKQSQVMYTYGRFVRAVTDDIVQVVDYTGKVTYVFSRFVSYCIQGLRE